MDEGECNGRLCGRAVDAFLGILNRLAFRRLNFVADLMHSDLSIALTA